MAKDDFVSNDLHKIRDKIADSSKKSDNSPSENSNSAAGKSDGPGSVSESVDKNENGNVNNIGSESKILRFTEEERKNALQARRMEFQKVKRDVAGRLTEKLAVLPKTIEDYRGRADNLEKSVEVLEKLLNELNALDDSQWDEYDFSTQLANAMKKVENTRLEFFRLSAKFEENSGEGASESLQGYHSILPEILSLSFKQLFRFGLCLCLPLIIALICTAFIVAIAILVSMRILG